MRRLCGVDEAFVCKIEGGALRLLRNRDGRFRHWYRFGRRSGYMDALHKYLSEQYGKTVKPAENLFDGFQNQDFCVPISGLVKEVVTSVSKISKDLRLMSSGPCAGCVKINLPALFPGFSFMPWKINPTVPEMVIQIAHQVVGNDVAIAITYDEGELDFNVWNAMFCKCLFESMQLVAEELVILRRDCVDGITANKQRCAEEANGSIALSTVVATFSYPDGVRVAHYCEQHGVTVAKAVVEMGLMTEEEAKEMIDPMLMTEPGEMAEAIKAFKAKKAAK